MGDYANDDLTDVTATPPPPEDVFDFALAVRAFARMTLAQQKRALVIMADLRYASVTDRFFEGVSQVISEMRKDRR